MQRYNRHSNQQASLKLTTKSSQRWLMNNLTRRGAQIMEQMPARSRSTCLQSANIKVLRLFRHICRIIPFFLMINSLNYRTTPIQTKIYIANHFRTNANMTDLVSIDFLVQQGYEIIFQGEWNITSIGYLYQYIFGSNPQYRDHGINLLKKMKANRKNQQPASQFLQSFYRGNKSHDC